MASKIQQVAISTTSGEVVGDHSYTEAAAKLDNTKEHEAEMKGETLNDVKNEADAPIGESPLLESIDSAERLPESTLQNIQGKKVTEQHEDESGNGNVDLNMEVRSEHDSKTESYKVIMCSDDIQRRGAYELFCHSKTGNLILTFPHRENNRKILETAKYLWLYLLGKKGFFL